MEYGTIEELQEDIRKNGTKDVVILKGITYTMDLYDSAGEMINYGNKRTFRGIVVETANRYGSNKFKDANVFETENIPIRNDIVYID